jgi:hypothetical protein
MESHPFDSAQGRLLRAERARMGLPVLQQVQFVIRGKRFVADWSGNCALDRLQNRDLLALL